MRRITFLLSLTFFSWTITLALAATKVIRLPPVDKNAPKVSREEEWIDNRWNQMDIGQFQASLLPTPNGIVAKGLSIRIGEQNEGAVCYDTFLCNVRAGWTGGFLEFDPARFGLIQSPKMAGPLQFVSPAGGAWNGTPRYHGFVRHGKRVVLFYDLGSVRIFESPWLETAGDLKVFTRTFELGKSEPKQFLFLAEFKEGKPVTNEIDGMEFVGFEKDGKYLLAAVTGNANAKLNAQNEKLNLDLPERDGVKNCKVFLWAGATNDLEKFAAAVKQSPAPENLQAFTKGGPPRWGEALTNKGSFTFSQSEPYVVDTITVPYENPYKALMFLSGVDFFENGDAAVCTIHGDVWIVSGLDGKLENLKWKRFATGLFQPLGLRVVRNKVHVLGRDQITWLNDINLDGEADLYGNFCNQIKTSVGGHDYVTSLEVDGEKNFYYVDPAGVHRISDDGRKHETIATGWRNPNGMGVSPDGVITVSPQEGEWTPASAICEVKGGGFYGYGGPQIVDGRPSGYDAPLCWIPRAIDSSTGSQVWVTSDRWGPLKGQMLSLSFSHCSMMLVLRENVNGTSQGGVVPLKMKFLSGAMRGTFRPQDGQLYVVGSHGWQTSAVRDGCFQRVRYTAEKVYLPTGLHIFQNGIELTFSEPLERETAEDTGSYAIEQWNYRYTKTYGSKEYSVSSPEEVAHDTMEIKSAKLASDGRTVFLEIPDLQPVMQMKIQFNLSAADGKTIRSEIYNSINQVGLSRKAD